LPFSQPHGGFSRFSYHSPAYGPKIDEAGLRISLDACFRAHRPGSRLRAAASLQGQITPRGDKQASRAGTGRCGFSDPKAPRKWGSSKQRLVETGGRLIQHARYYWLLLAEGHLTRRLFGGMLRKIVALLSPAG
jgi:hypothetical protein